MHANSALDFSYPWWLSYGHIVILAPAAALLFLGWKRRWGKWTMRALALLAIWSCAAIAVTRFVININQPPELPTASFLRSGKGRVLDIGAGTGRSSIMVLQARPEATLVASDLFGESFQHHFGSGPSPQDKLRANLAAAGVAQRAAIETADMRKLPFEPASFDAVVSAYAMDHLNRQGSDEALAEAARVLKPGGDFLLILVENDRWTRFAFGPLLSHGGTRGAGWWTEHVRQAGFEVTEQGAKPMTLYLLARKSL
jgi:SAM-dependent methyltransferase